MPPGDPAISPPIIQPAFDRRPSPTMMQRPPFNRATLATIAAAMVGLVVSIGVGTSSAQLDQPAPGETVTAIAPLADAAVASSRPSARLGGRPSLITATDPGSGFVAASYLRFAVVTPDPVVSVTLQVFAQGTAPAGFTVAPVSGSWDEATITFLKAPQPGAVTAASGPVTVGTWASVDVTTLAAGGGTFSVVLAGADPTKLSFPSREGSVPPRLVIRTASPSPSPSPSPSSDPSPSPTPSPSSSPPSSSAPPPGGYFSLVPAGSWAGLPSTAQCAADVRRSTWEPRPENQAKNAAVPDRPAVSASLSSRPRSGSDPHVDTWALPRIDGNFTGTTDEIFQWAACKWGLPDDFVRAVAATESSWYQYLTYADSRCRETFGCGDIRTDQVYCDHIAQLGGYDYQNDYGPGRCPATFGISGVMSHDPWDDYAGRQNGTFPFNRDSTAFNLDYFGSVIRSCFEGWTSWLKTNWPTYGPGDLWGCAGLWYSGEWHTTAADGYIGRVKALLGDLIWLDPSWMAPQYPR
jgi:hypothetical protein